MSHSTDKEILQNLIDRGIITVDDISDSEDMKKKEKVLEVHTQTVWQGKTDKRWFTRIKDDEGRHLIRKKTEKELFDYLYDYYFGKEKSYKTCTLTDIYNEWLEYKIKTSNSSLTPYRLDADYKKFYLEEEPKKRKQSKGTPKKKKVSEKIISTPLIQLTPADIKEWAYTLINTYHLTHKAWMNARSVLKQVYDYLIDKGVTEKNPVQLVRIPKGVCKKSGKKDAKTQIFYTDEIAEIIAEAMKRAEETGDIAFLAIPLFFYTGIRIGECLALNFADCKESEHLISITKMLAAKTERLPDGTWSTRKYELVDHAKGESGEDDDRDVIVTDECFELIQKIKRMQAKSGAIFFNLFPDISPSNVQFKLYRLCEDLDLTRRSPHKWRKTYISKLLNDGYDPDFVREQVGHKDLQTTLNSYVYSTTRPEEQVEKLKKTLSL